MSSGTSKTIKTILFVAVTATILVVLYSLVFRVEWGGATVYKVQFDYIGTVMVGSPARKSGVKIGSVSKVEINEADQKTVFIYLSIYSGHVISTTDRVGIVSGGILGDQFVEVFPGEPGSPAVPKGAVIIGDKSLDLRGLAVQGEAILGDVGSSSKIIAEFLNSNKESLSRTVKNLEILTTNLATVSTDVLSLPAVVEREITRTGNTLNDSLGRISTQAESLIARIDQTLGSGGADIQRGMKNLADMSLDMKNLLQNLNKEDGVISLFKSKEFTQNIELTMKNIKASTDSLKKVADALAASFTP